MQRIELLIVAQEEIPQLNLENLFWVVLLRAVFFVCFTFYSFSKCQKYIWYQDKKFLLRLVVFTLEMFVEGYWIPPGSLTLCLCQDVDIQVFRIFPGCALSQALTYHPSHFGSFVFYFEPTDNLQGQKTRYSTRSSVDDLSLVFCCFGRGWPILMRYWRRIPFKRGFWLMLS